MKLYYPDPIIADRIQQVFWDHDLNDVATAKETKTDRKTISSYRNCLTNPSIRFVRWLCITYNVSADWLLNIRED